MKFCLCQNAKRLFKIQMWILNFQIWICYTYIYVWINIYVCTYIYVDLFVLWISKTILHLSMHFYDFQILSMVQNIYFYIYFFLEVLAKSVGKKFIFLSPINAFTIFPNFIYLFIIYFVLFYMGNKNKWRHLWARSITSYLKIMPYYKL